MCAADGAVVQRRNKTKRRWVMVRAKEGKVDTKAASAKNIGLAKVFLP